MSGCSAPDDAARCSGGDDQWPVTAEMQPATAWLRRRLRRTMSWGCIFRIPELYSFRIVEFLSRGKHL
jgi:hypothetical protein